MIQTFRCQETEKLFFRKASAKFPANILRVAQRKLALLDAAESLDDLRIPPGNRLEKLKGDREGEYSIRINNLTISGDYVLNGIKEMLLMLKLLIIIMSQLWNLFNYCLSILEKFY